MGVHAKSIWRILRRLKKSCTVAHDIMKSLMKLPSLDAVSSNLFCSDFDTKSYSSITNSMFCRRSYGLVLKALS